MCRSFRTAGRTWCLARRENTNTGTRQRFALQGTSSQYTADPSLVEAFQRLSEDSLNELEAALLVARVVDADIDIERVRERIASLEAAARSQGAVDVEGLLDLLRAQGFAQTSLADVDLSHSSIDWLLQQHQGLPIVVAVLVVTVARGLGMLAEGVNYPGHFLLRVDDALIDPLAMAVVDESSLRKIPGLTKDQMLSPASPVTMAFRMLNNLKAYYMRFENWSAMLLVTAYQMGIVHDDIALLSLVYFERGEYCQRMNDNDAALAEYARCAQLSPEAELVARANARMKQLLADDRGPVH
ncbi:MAG: hypothetical protein CMQ18_08610 [Gammaproteobacteria bacterium]|nr:hypothetical protein [Gammaproteobacteria bacterium]